MEFRESFITDNISIFDQRITRFSEVPAHYHSRLELFYPMKGDVMLYAENRNHLIKQGDVAIITPEGVHSVSFTGTDALCRVISIDLMYLADHRTDPVYTYFIRPMMDQECMVTPSIDRNFAGPLRNLIDKLYISVKESSYLEMKAYSFLLIDRLYRMDLITGKKGLENQKVKEVIRYIQDNCREDLPVRDMAERFGYSESHFIRWFKEASGMTPGNFIITTRVHEASKMLKETQKPVTAIAYDCGFPSTSFFIRIFKRHYGVTPLQYRKNS